MLLHVAEVADRQGIANQIGRLVRRARRIRTIDRGHVASNAGTNNGADTTKPKANEATSRVVLHDFGIGAGSFLVNVPEAVGVVHDVQNAGRNHAVVVPFFGNKVVTIRALRDADELEVVDEFQHSIVITKGNNLVDNQP